MMKIDWQKIHLMPGKMMHWIRKNPFRALAISAAGFGLVGFIKSDQTNGILDVVNNTIGLFAFSYPADNNFILDIAKLLASATVFFGILSLFYARKLNDWQITRIQLKPYDLIIGWDDQTRLF